MEFIISLDHLGPGSPSFPVGGPVLCAGALKIVPDAAIWEGLGVCTWCPPAHRHRPCVSSDWWHIQSNLYGHDSLMYLLDFTLAPSGQEVRLPGD